MRAPAAALVLTLLAAAPAAARDPVLRFPVDCTLGQDCFIQNHVDRDPGPGAGDFMCGLLSYDGHKGTDIALPTAAAMEAGVAVRAVAPGTVRRVRDGMPDTPGEDPGELDGRDCGNGVVVNHGGGWLSQYCHLKQGSVAVSEGQRVTARTVLGEIGHSGRTEFPHLHLSLRHDGEIVDPFHPEDPVLCGTAPARDLWDEEIPYVAGGLIDVGLSATTLDYAAVKAGTAAVATLEPDAPVILLWAHMFGVRAGDIVTLELTAPGGEVIADRTVTLDRAQARRVEAVGKGRGSGPWPPGAYVGEAVFSREGEELGRGSARLTVRAD